MKYIVRQLYMHIYIYMPSSRGKCDAKSLEHLLLLPSFKMKRVINIC